MSSNGTVFRVSVNTLYTETLSWKRTSPTPTQPTFSPVLQGVTRWAQNPSATPGTLFYVIFMKNFSSHFQLAKEQAKTLTDLGCHCFCDSFVNQAKLLVNR